MDHGFHGRTLATMAASGKPQWEHAVRAEGAGLQESAADDLAAVEAAITPNTVAVMLEPIQGEAGVFVASDEFLRACARSPRGTGMLLILDEIQTGIGRTGQFFGFEHAGVAPDIMTLGKGLGGGVPLGAAGRARGGVLLRARRPGRHVQRQPAHDRGRLRGDGGDRRGPASCSR